MESDIQAIVLGSQLHETVVWLTSMKTGKPVRGAKVSFYRNTVGGYQVWQMICDICSLHEIKSNLGWVCVLECRSGCYFDPLNYKYTLCICALLQCWLEVTKFKKKIITWGPSRQVPVHVLNRSESYY